MRCDQCKYWAGNKYCDWADCYRVIEVLDSRLLSFTSRLNYGFSTPFDPHDAKYFIHNPGFYKIYKKLSRSKHLPDGVRVHSIKQLDTVFNNQTGEFREIKEVPLYFYQTRNNFQCQKGEYKA